ncbi:MAG: PadR family transcriptional regulator [Actinomycetota bacterium]
MRELTTTSYAVLGLLSVRSWTAYELTKQMSRSLSHIWPRAVSAIYKEPKYLVVHGLATASVEDNGERRRTRYSITPEGRTALKQWLAQPSAPPQFESEALVRVEFAEQGAKEDLLRTLRDLQEQADELKARRLAQLEGYLNEGGPFPERMHIHALIGPLMIEQAALFSDWARRAEEEVSRWPDVSQTAAPRGLEIIRAFLSAHKEEDRRRDGRRGDAGSATKQSQATSVRRRRRSSGFG